MDQCLFLQRNCLKTKELDSFDKVLLDLNLISLFEFFQFILWIFLCRTLWSQKWLISHWWTWIQEHYIWGDIYEFLFFWWNKLTIYDMFLCCKARKIFEKTNECHLVWLLHSKNYNNQQFYTKYCLFWIKSFPKAFVLLEIRTT